MADYLIRLLQETFTPILFAVVALTLAFISSIVFRTFLKSDTLISQRGTERIEEKVAKLELEIRNLHEAGNAAVPLSDADRVEFLVQLRERIASDLTTEAIKSELATLQAKQVELLEADSFTSWSRQASARITQQIDALGGRANLNLFIGLTLAITGVGFLIYYVQTGLSAHTDIVTFVVQFLPRLSLVTIIELFSYFFLRLYKQAIDEIKFFQNEITNIDLKMLAATITQKLCPMDPSVIIAALATTERNFLVPKDQRIVAEVAETNIQTATQRILEMLRDISPTNRNAPPAPPK